jgi:excisionase family DNA binding protein
MGQGYGLDRSDVEQLALERYTPQPWTYWLTTRQAADVLGVTPVWVRQLVKRGFLPAVTHDGHRYFRRHQVEVIANARESRRLR